MKSVVYFLGAGFSAPAGLPVISNFLFRARDQFFREPLKYNYFKEVFQYIDGLSKAKNFINLDLFNIEEVFSVADTHELLGKGIRKQLEQFIKEVFVFHTPQYSRLSVRLRPNLNIIEVLFSNTNINQLYVSFVSALLHVIFEAKNPDSRLADYSYEDIAAVQNNVNGVEYKFISLNYDMVIENCVNFLNNNFNSSFVLPLAKLHGSVDDKIVPPTWNKNIDKGLEDNWRKAAKWLSEANEIRILGYSLPPTDIYIKHLLSTAFVESENLQKLDAICLDHDGSVKERYSRMFNFPRFQFLNKNISEYLERFRTRYSSIEPLKVLWRDVEQIHNTFVG